MGGGFWGPILVLPPLFIQQYCWMNHHPGAGNALQAHMPAAGRVSVLLSHLAARRQAESCLQEDTAHPLLPLLLCLAQLEATE
jgi:hypothetical protein